MKDVVESSIKQLNMSSEEKGDGQPSARSNFKRILEMFPHRKTVSFQKNQCLFEEGDKICGIYYLCGGKVKLLKEGAHRKSYIVKLTRGGDLLGLSGINNHSYANSAIALEAVTTCFIPLTDLLQALKSNPLFSLRIMRVLCEEIDEAEQRLSGFSKKTARERVAEMLLTLKSIYGTDNNEYLDILLSRKELANFVGTTSETLSRLMNEFQKKRLIRIEKKRIRLLDTEKLNEIARVLSY